MTRLFKLGFRFLLSLLIMWEDSIPDFDRKHFSFHSLELISTVFSHSAVARFLSRLLYLLSCCVIFTCYTSYSVVAFFHYIYRVGFYAS